MKPYKYNPNYSRRRYKSGVRKPWNRVIGWIVILALLIIGNYALNKYNEYLNNQVRQLEEMKKDLENQNKKLEEELKIIDEKIKREVQIKTLLKPYEKYKHEEVKRYIAETVFDTHGPEVAKQALWIVSKESGFNPNAENHNTNLTYDKGAWQINDVHKLPDTIRTDYKEATKWAMAKYDRNGDFCIWSAAKCQ